MLKGIKNHLTIHNARDYIIRSVFNCRIFRLCHLVLTVSGTRWRPFLGSRRWFWRLGATSSYGQVRGTRIQSLCLVCAVSCLIGCCRACSAPKVNCEPRGNTDEPLSYWLPFRGLLFSLSQRIFRHVGPVVSCFFSAPGPFVALPNRLPAMAPSPQYS